MSKNKLKQLKELDAYLDVLMMDKKEAVDSVITPEIKTELNIIDTEFDEISASVTNTIAILTNEIKDEVLASGSSIKKGSGYYGASFVKGQVSWDTKALDGYAAAHPEIERFKKIGNPSVRINKKS